MRRITLLLLLAPIIWLAACSDDESPVSPTSAPQLTATQPPAADSAVQGTVAVDFTGAPEERPNLEAPFSVQAGSTAWDAVKAALGEDNLSYQDFGGDLGVFVTGFNGVEAQGNHFWEFRVNGEGSDVGVSTYEVQPGDMIEFVYSSF